MLFRSTEMLTSVPNTTLQLISLSLLTINGKDVSQSRYGASKILDMLGYGSFLAPSNAAKAAITKAYLGIQSLEDDLNPLVYSASQAVNILPLLAYQKIYYDFFSESQWEKHLAYAYNVDYWDGKTQLNLAPEMLQLRYANYPKDYFMGMLPNSQYGSVAVLPSVDPSWSPFSIFASGVRNSSILNPANGVTVQANSPQDTITRTVRLNADLSALLS